MSLGGGGSQKVRSSLTKREEQHLSKGSTAYQAPANELPAPITPRHPGPKLPRRSIPPEEWPAVLRRVVENQEPLRKVAGDYGVPYETVRRVVRKAKRRNRE